MAGLAVVAAPRRDAAACAIAAAMLVGAAACGGPAITLTIDGDRPVPAALDAMCVGVADRDLGGGAFGRSYRLAGSIDHLPQTLAVEAGAADRAIAWTRGYRGGVPVAFDRADVDFGGDVTLRLDRCPRGHGGAIAMVGSAAATGRLVTSTGAGGTVAVAVASGGASVIDARDGALIATPIDGAAGTAAIAFDADGDCDDDLAIASAGAATLIYVRDGTGFTAGERLPGAAAMGAAAVVAADVDRDGDQDLVLGSGGSVSLYRNDGAGGFAEAVGAIDASGLTAVSALAAGDLDGDGIADLVIGQDGAPSRALIGDPSGAGVLTAAPAVFPAISLRVRDLVAADLDGDLDLDVIAMIANAPAHVYINRGGVLEDQSFVRLPQPAPSAVAAAAGDWDGDCAPDLILAAATTAALRGGATADAPFTAETSLGAATAATLADLDDDGDPDLLLSGAATDWYRR